VRGAWSRVNVLQCPTGGNHAFEDQRRRAGCVLENTHYTTLSLGLINIMYILSSS